MITSHVGSPLDLKIRDRGHTPAFRVEWFCRMLDTDSDIVRGTYRQLAFDLTPYVLNGNLNLDMSGDASSLALTVSLEKLPISAFYNCVIKLYEGDENTDPDTWPCTFTGWNESQPAATESGYLDVKSAVDSRGTRGGPRTISINLISRERRFSEIEITSNGAWLPNVTPQSDPVFTYRDAYDDIGSIAHELATDPDWGMGLEPDEVLIGTLDYRIQKQLQFVQVTPLEALRILGEVLHLVPQFNGEGKLRYISRRLDEPTVRTYTHEDIGAIPQAGAALNELNCLLVTAQDKELSEVVMPEQRLFKVETGTFGFFDPKMEFQGTWGEDEQQTWRVKVAPSVVDGNGATVPSPSFKNFHDEGFINTISPPRFVKATELDYKIEIENDTALVIALLTAMFATYIGLKASAKAAEENSFATHIHVETGVNTQPPVNGSTWSISTSFEAAASLALILGLGVMRQIGNFTFEVWGVPYETVYKQLKVEANLQMFGGISGGSQIRSQERKVEEIENNILSTLEDSVVPAGPSPSQDAVTNPGVKTFAERELAIRLVEKMPVDVEIHRDILLEPGDTFLVEDTGLRYKVKAISREIARGASPIMTATVFRVP